MKQLYKLKRVESMSNVHDLRKLYDKVESSIRNLNSLGISSETYGAFLVPLLTGKLSTSLRLSVARKMTSEIWNLTDMMYYFIIEIVAHERCSTVNINSDNRSFDIEEDSVICRNLPVLVFFVKNVILYTNVEKLQTYLNKSLFSVKMVAVFYV